MKKNADENIVMTEADVAYFKKQIVPFFTARGVAEDDIKMLVKDGGWEEWAVYVIAPGKPFKEDVDGACEDFHKFYIELGGSPDAYFPLGVNESEGTFKVYVSPAATPKAVLRRQMREIRAEEKAEEKRQHKAYLERRKKDKERARTLFSRLKAGELKSKTEDGFLVMAGECYDDIESGDQTVETRDFTEYNLKRTIGIKTVRLQRGYGHPGKPPKQMRYEVAEVCLLDECMQECDPFDIPKGFTPIYIGLKLGKRIG